jgi:hypothetical protein
MSSRFAIALRIHVNFGQKQMSFLAETTVGIRISEEPVEDFPSFLELTVVDQLSAAIQQMIAKIYRVHAASMQRVYWHRALGTLILEAWRKTRANFDANLEKKWKSLSESPANFPRLACISFVV